MRRKFELFKDRKGEFRWRLISSKKVIATSGEGYSKKAGARQGIRAVVNAISGNIECDIPIVDLTITVQKVTPKKVGNGAKGNGVSTKETAKKVVKKVAAKKATKKAAAHATA